VHGESRQALAAQSIPADDSMPQQLQSSVVKVLEIIPLTTDAGLFRPGSKQAQRIEATEPGIRRTEPCKPLAW
tara:strand:+ start:52 stop:270 length:219 start_codon:yes stop_codon:yes gene_type:complete